MRLIAGLIVLALAGVGVWLLLTRIPTSPTPTGASILRRGELYPVVPDSVRSLGFSALDAARLEEVLKERDPHHRGITNLRLLVLKGQVPCKRTDLEFALGANWLASQNSRVSVSFKTTDDTGIERQVLVRDKDPLRVLGYFILVRDDQKVVFDPGELTANVGWGSIYRPTDTHPPLVEWLDGVCLAAPGNFVPLKERDFMVPNDILARDTVK